MNISDFRKKYPQYNDMSDIDLAKKLHAKFYSDLPMERFMEKFGMYEKREESGVPAWGQEHPNIYGAVGAVKELAKSLPYAKYADPEERKAFANKTQDEQTNDLLGELVNAELTVAAGPALKWAGKGIGAVARKVAPKLTETLTKGRTLFTPKVEAVPVTPTPKPTSQTPSGFPAQSVQGPDMTIEEVRVMHRAAVKQGNTAEAKTLAGIIDDMRKAEQGRIVSPAPEVSAPVENPTLESIVPQVQGGKIGPTPKYAEGSSINMDQWNTTDDVRQFTNGITKTIEKSIGKRVQSWDETRVQAEELGWNIKDLKKAAREKGAFSAAEMDAARQVNLNTIEETFNAIRNLPQDRSQWGPEVRAQFLDMMDAIRATSRMSSEAGRALNIHKKVLMNDPSFTDASKINKILNMIEGKGVKRTDDLIDALRKIDVNNPAEVNRFVYNATSTGWQKLSDVAWRLWMEGLVSGPQTHIANITGNAGTLGISQYPERALAAGVDWARSALTGKPREVFLGETVQDLRTMSAGLRGAWQRAASAIDNGALTSKLDINPSAGVIPDKVAKFLPTRGLTVEDEFFKGFIEHQELQRLAYRMAKKGGYKGAEFGKKVAQFLDSPTEDMLEQAATRSKYLTYQEDLGEIGKTLMRLRDDIPGARYFFPFVKTPSNIAKFALERTPFNLPLVLHRIANGTYKGAQISEELAKPLMGSIIGITSYLMADQGYITGAAPRNAADREEKLRTGWQPFSFKADDTYYSFARLEPIGTILGMAATMADLKDSKEKQNIAVQMLGAISKGITDKTFMQGFSQLVAGMYEPQKWKQTVHQFAGSLVPGVVANVARAEDTQQRDIQTVGQRMMSRVPGLVENVPEKLTVWGEENPRPGSQIGRLISPMQTSAAKGSPIDHELMRLKFDLGYPSKTLSGVEIPQDEYWQVVKMAGAPAKRILDMAASSGAWQNMSDEDRTNYIKGIVDSYRRQARQLLQVKMFRDGRLVIKNGRLVPKED